MFSPEARGVYIQAWELVGILDDGGPRVNLRVQMVGEAQSSCSSASSYSGETSRSAPSIAATSLHQEHQTKSNMQQDPQQPTSLPAPLREKQPEGRRSVAAVAPNVASKKPVLNGASAASSGSAAASGAQSGTSSSKGTKKKPAQNVTLKVFLSALTGLFFFYFHFLINTKLDFFFVVLRFEIQDYRSILQ